jgi:D-alanyl-lipoteichoic acid acyltransferase DltB (MBOAT superfamily)
MAEAVLNHPVAETETVKPVADPREARAVPSLAGFALIMVQLAGLMAVFRVFSLEERSFHILAALSFSGFAVHYWLPFKFKEWFWIALSLGGAYVLIDPRSATALIAIGLVIYGIATAPMPFRLRVGMLVALGALLAYGRATLGFGMTNRFWQVLGAIFMFRVAVYLYDIRHSKSAPTLREYLAYFLVLPNFYFLLFPVIDYQTARKTYFQRDIHLIVQQGINWILRGTVQLLLYRAIYYLKPASDPETVTSFWTLAALMVGTYLLYLRVSGHFHIIVGLMHLFGYDLPETHRRYLLARTLTDFWRRINIYWKDFMVKLVYFPVYFRLRRSGERRAQIVATALVFVVTWLLHSYQWFWLRGAWLFTWTDTLFWAILGSLVIVNVLLEQRRKVVTLQDWQGRATVALQTAGTFCFIVVLWSFWNAPTVDAWVDLVTWWQVN